MNRFGLDWINLFPFIHSLQYITVIFIYLHSFLYCCYYILIVIILITFLFYLCCLSRFDSIRFNSIYNCVDYSYEPLESTVLLLLLLFIHSFSFISFFLFFHCIDIEIIDSTSYFVLVLNWCPVFLPRYWHIDHHLVWRDPSNESFGISSYQWS